MWVILSLGGPAESSKQPVKAASPSNLLKPHTQTIHFYPFCLHTLRNAHEVSVISYSSRHNSLRTNGYLRECFYLCAIARHRERGNR